MGKTTEGMLPDVLKGKHPHARGEDSHYGREELSHRETPPRTWGRLCRIHLRLFCNRNTPTHVGKTTLITDSLCQGWKHPHARGEDVLARSIAPPSRETPPRTWGRRSLSPLVQRLKRNTPTHVGKTGLLHKGHGPEEKHPHARGEDVAKAVNERLGEETPPRTWGRLTHVLFPNQEKRNTPTHVGKTLNHEDMGTETVETPPRTWGRRARG